jgi:hypothetical protein
VAANSTPAAICEALPDIQQDALHNLPCVMTGGTAVGTLPPQSTLKKCKRGVRGKDKKQRTRRCVDVKSSMERMPIHALVGARAEAVYANISKQMES